MTPRCSTRPTRSDSSRVRLNLEGPLFDGNGSWLVAGRRTYADLFLGLASDPEVRESTAYFYDLNAKANARYGATGQVMVSGYFGRDRLKVGSVASVGWGNAAGTMRWNHGFGSIFSHVTLAFSDYDYHIQSGFNARAVSLDSRVPPPESERRRILDAGGSRPVAVRGGHRALRSTRRRSPSGRERTRVW